MRALSEIYEELGFALLHAGDDLSAEKKTTQADSRYEEAAQAFMRALREGGYSPTLGKGLARAREGQRRFEDALRAYLEVVRADPVSAVEVLPMAHRGLTPALARALGAWLDSEWIPDIMGRELDPVGRAAVGAFLGRISLYRADYLAATRQYQAAFDVEPDNPFVLEGLGEALWRAGQAADAVSILEDAVCRADAARLRDRSVTTRLKLGWTYMELGRHQASIRVLRQGFALGKDAQANLWTALARGRLALGRFDGAVKAAESAMEHDDGLAAPHAVLAAVRLEQGRYNDAVDAAEAALRRDPHDFLALRVEGRALLDGKIDVDQGIRLIRKYLEHAPADNEYRLVLARALRSASHAPSEVIDLLKSGIEVKSVDQPASLYLELAKAYVDAGDLDSTLLVLDHPAAKGRGADLGQWWQIRGDVLRAQGNMAGAFDAYERAVEVSPHNGRLKLNLALAARGAGDNQRAWSAVREAIKGGVYGDDRAKAFTLQADLADAMHLPHGELVEAYYEAGRQFYRQGDFERALHWLARATDLNPAYRDARWYRVESLRQQASQPGFPYWNADRIDDVRQAWEETLASGPPERNEAWGYISGALIADMQSQFHPPAQHAALVWEAVTYLERSLLLNDPNASAWVHLSRFHNMLGNYANALIALERALQIDPDNLAAIDVRIIILADCGDVKGVRELVDKRLQRERTTWAEGAHAFVLYLEDNLDAAVEQISRVIDSDPDNIWPLSFRGDCLRLLALSANARGNYRERAQDDYRKILERRGDNSYLAHEATFAWAAYGLGEVQLAAKILEPLLGNSLDPSYDLYRTIGCCYLRLGDLDKAEASLNRGIDYANTAPQLKTLDSLLLAEIEQDAADWPNYAPVFALLQRARARMDRARKRVEEPPSPQNELRSFIEGEQARVQSGEWGWIGAHVSLARIALGADELEQAETIYRALGQYTQRFPEAGLGLARVAARYNELGEKALGKGWDQTDARKEAVRLCERALAVGQSISSSDHGKRLVLMALAYFQADATQHASTTFAAAAWAFETAGESDLGAMLGEVCQTFLPDVTRYWALDAYFRRLMHEQHTSERLRSVLPRAIERLGDYLGTVLELTVGKQPHLPVVTPIMLEVSGNLAPEEGKEEEWPLLKRFIPEMRERIEDETGVRVPGVRIRSNETELPDDTYIIMLDEVPVVSGRVSSRAKYSPSAMSALEAVSVPVTELEEATHPLSKQPGWWIPQKYWNRVQQAEGCTLWPDPMQFTVAHLEAILRSNLADFLGVQEVSNLLEYWGQTDERRALIATALPDTLARERFVLVLRTLVRERVPITAWESILMAVREVGLGSDETGEVVRRVRLAIKADLPGNRPGAKLVTVPPEIDRVIIPWVTIVNGRRFFAIPPEEIQELLTKVRELVRGDDPATVLVTEAADVREPLHRVVEIEFPSIMVQSREETLDEEDRKTSLAWVPLIAEWCELWPQNVEARNAN